MEGYPNLISPDLNRTFEGIINSLTWTFENKMSAFTIALENLKANPFLQIYVKNPYTYKGQAGTADSRDPVFEMLQSQMKGIWDQLQNLVPVFVEEYLVRWKWSELGYPTNSFEMNESVKLNVTNWLDSLMDGVELLLRANEAIGQTSATMTTLRDLEHQLSEHLMVVNEQPPQALKQGVNFTTGIKFIRENKAGNGASPQFKIFVLNETEAAKLYQSKMPSPVTALRLEDKRNFMTKKDIQISGDEFSFGNLQIKKDHKVELRGPGKGIRTLNKKSVLLVTTTIDVGGTPLEVWACSVPVVLITHRKQECGATATFFWDNYFRPEGRIPFQVPDEVPWSHFKEGINCYFKWATNTNRDLSAHDLAYIGAKIFGNGVNFEVENLYVNRIRFCTVAAKKDEKDEVTPWTWIYHITTLIKERLQKPWELGSIVGFIDRTVAENYLKEQETGAFLLRFSDSRLGGISISACTPKGITSVGPWFSADLGIFSLEQRLGDLKDLKKAIVYKQEIREYGTAQKEDVFSLPPAPELTPVIEEETPYEASGLKVAIGHSMSNVSLQSPPTEAFGAGTSRGPSPGPSSNVTPVHTKVPSQIPVQSQYSAPSQVSVPTQTFVPTQIMIKRSTSETVRLSDRQSMGVKDDFRVQFEKLESLHKQLHRIVEMEVAPHSEHSGQNDFPGAKSGICSSLLAQVHNLTEVFVKEFLKQLKWSDNCSSCPDDKDRSRQFLQMIEDCYRNCMRIINFFFTLQNEQEAQQQLAYLRQSLLKNSTLFHKQPPELLSKSKSFSIGITFLETLENPTICGVYLLTQMEATMLFDVKATNEGEARPSTVLNLDPSRNIMKDMLQGNCFNIVHFINLTFNKSKLLGNNLTTNRHLLFVTTVEGDQNPTEIWCISRSLVTISNTSQTCEAKAFVFWDSYFKKEGRPVSQGLEEVAWSQFASAINLYFKKTANTRWNLTYQNLQYIGSKIFQRQDFDPSSMVSRASFCSVPSDKKAFSVWRWLYMIVQLIKKHLRQSWDSGAIFGFLAREKAEELIQQQEVGTFLIRFSTSVIGGVSYFVAVPPEAGDLKNCRKSGVHSIIPLMDSEVSSEQSLNRLSLNNRILMSSTFKKVLCYDPGLNYSQVVPKDVKFISEASIQSKSVEENTLDNPWQLSSFLMVRRKNEDETPFLKRLKIDTSAKSVVQEGTVLGETSVEQTNEPRYPNSNGSETATLWNKIKQLPENLKARIYRKYTTESISIQVRDILAYWIETNLISNNEKVICSDEMCKVKPGGLKQFQKELIEQIQKEASRRRKMIHVYHQLFKISKDVQKLDPQTLYSRLERCLNEELSIVPSLKDPVVDEMTFLKNQMNDAKLHLSEWKNMVKEMTALESEIKLFSMKLISSDKKREELIKVRDNCLNLAKTVVQLFEEVVGTLQRPHGLMYLIKWQRITSLQQQRNMVSTIKNWYSIIFETLRDFEVLWNSRTYSKILENCGRPKLVQLEKELIQRINVIGETLLKNALFFQDKPVPQVVESLAEVRVQVDILFTDSSVTYGIKEMITVTFHLLNEDQALKLFLNASSAENPSDTSELEMDGQVLNNELKKYPKSLREATQILKLQGIKALARDGPQKKLVLAVTEFAVNDQRYQTWCCSSPIRYIVEPRQRTKACSSIFWENYFSTESQSPFEVQNYVTWSSMQLTLSRFFSTMTKSTRQLNSDHFAYLGRKLFENHPFSSDSLVEQNLTWRSFWNWFLPATELTAKYLPFFWERGFIVGFIVHQAVADILISRFPIGSFALCFSDSIKGAVQIIALTYKNGEKQILNMIPFTERELKAANLVQRLLDLKSPKITTLIYLNDNDEWISMEKQAAISPQSINLF